MTSASRPHLLAIGIAAVLIAWQAAVAAIELAVEGAASNRFRFGSEHAFVAEVLGDDSAVYDAVLEHVPPVAYITVSLEPAKLPPDQLVPRLMLTTHLRSLLYPRGLITRQQAAELAAAGTFDGAPTFLLDLSPVEAFDTAGFERLASNDRFVLYRQPGRDR
ncbi:MAG: hypothetical protein KDC98_24370 [Planctomycetes bacterium]|nr:hypothetical protein [Planctomycetota bacterium]